MKIHDNIVLFGEVNLFLSVLAEFYIATKVSVAQEYTPTLSMSPELDIENGTCFIILFVCGSCGDRFSLNMEARTTDQQRPTVFRKFMGTASNKLSSRTTTLPPATYNFVFTVSSFNGLFYIYRMAVSNDTQQCENRGICQC